MIYYDTTLICYLVVTASSPIARLTTSAPKAEPLATHWLLGVPPSQVHSCDRRESL
jgi:hypothetical protein